MSRNSVHKALHAGGELLTSAVTHPRLCGSALMHSLQRIRANMNAVHKYRLPMICHEALDPRLVRQEVLVGGADIIDYSKVDRVNGKSAVNYMKALIVARFTKLIAPQRVLEIGTYRGAMTYHMARNAPESCRLWTADLPNSATSALAADMIGSDVEMARMDDSLVGIEWRERPESARITQLWGDSMKFDFSPYGPFDLIYIDGSHAEPWVEKDTENAFRLLSPTGAILWDDALWDDVLRVLSRWSKQYPIYLFDDGQTAGYLRIDSKSVSIHG